MEDPKIQEAIETLDSMFLFCNNFINIYKIINIFYPSFVQSMTN